jgi:hypothetical protein
MKNILKISLILILAQTAEAQSFKLGLNTGFGTYQMTDLKEFQSDAADYYSGFNVKEVQQFPGYFNYTASAELSLGRINLIGINAGYYTTGGRNHVADYSGEYALNMPVNAYSLGLQYRNIFNTVNKFSFYAQFKGGISFSSLSIDESFTIHQVDSTSSSYSFVNHSFYIEPSLGSFYDLGNNFSVNFSIGYQVDIESKLHYKDNKEQEAVNFHGEPMHTNWTGLRIALGLTYDLFKHKVEPNTAPTD